MLCFQTFWDSGILTTCRFFYFCKIYQDVLSKNSQKSLDWPLPWTGTKNSSNSTWPIICNSYPIGTRFEGHVEPMCTDVFRSFLWTKPIVQYLHKRESKQLWCNMPLLVLRMVLSQKARMVIAIWACRFHTTNCCRTRTERVGKEQAIW